MFMSFRSQVRRLLHPSMWNAHVPRLYKEGEYIEAYSSHTDLRVVRDPHEAVGGMWEEMGQLQLDFLLLMGLRPADRLLDIGCGTLRGGRHFIRYLESGGYTGIDISKEAIAYARSLVDMEGLAAKRPRLLISRNRDLKFEEFAGETFDVLLAQSVFTHLQPEHIEECFRHVSSIMHPASTFYFTYAQGPEFTQTRVKDFRYPPTFFQHMADRYDLHLADHSADYPHPRGQLMASLRLEPATEREDPHSAREDPRVVLLEDDPVVLLEDPVNDERGDNRRP
jgi:SAM-dependent methyltransferase